MRKLPKPRFNLKSPSARKETLIFMVFRYRGKKLLYSTGLIIHPDDWDFDLQRPIEKENRSDLWKMHRELDNLASICKSIFIESDYGAIEVVDFKKSLDVLTNKITEDSPLGGVDSIKTPSFFEFIELELAEMKETSMKHDTWRMFKLHANNLKKFAKYRGAFDFEDVDWNLRLELVDWLAGRNDQLGYGNKTLKILRQFMERARRKKLHDNTDYQGIGWTVSRTKAKGNIIILNPQELQILADLKLFGFAEKVRDLFLIGAATGQRFSDFSKYQPTDFYKTINGIPIVSVISQKTHTPAKIPLNIFPWLIPVLEKYGYQSPKMSMQKFNEWIKDICKKAKFDEPVLIVEQYMGRKPRIEKSHAPKYSKISSHTCRRSFATNLYRMGYSLAQIMPMTGHSTESQLRDYIGIDSEQNAEEIAFSIIQKRGSGKNNAGGLRKISNS
jgi:integrase